MWERVIQCVSYKQNDCRSKECFSAVVFVAVIALLFCCCLNRQVQK